MRRTDREIREPEKIKEIMEQCDVCRLGLADQDEVYIVPLNFGCRQEGGKWVLYFHGASQGRKIDLIRQNARVSFEMDTAHVLTEGGWACEYGMDYLSVMGRGEARLLEDREEKLEGLRCIMEHYTKKAVPFPEKAADKTAVIRLEVTGLSAKGRGVR